MRVIVDGEVMIENRAHHGSPRDEGSFTLNTVKTVSIRAEHFELNGYAILELGLAPQL